MQTFETKLAGKGDGPTGIVVPPEIVEALGKGKRPGVQVTVNGYAYLSTIATMGGDFMIPFSSDHRKATGLKAGDQVTVTLVPEDKPREVDLPEGLAQALEVKGLRAKFDGLAPSRRKEYARQVAEAKAEDTRNRRIEKIVGELS